MLSRVLYGVADRALGLISRRGPAGVRQAVQMVRQELRFLRRHRRGVAAARRYRTASKVKLHLGCGGTRKPGWVNIDARGECDLTLDLREPLPFRDGSCAAVYSEHFLEHVDYPDAALALLRECWRVLEPGGVFDVGVPDTEWPLMEYAGRSRDGYFEKVKARHPAWCETRLEHINYHFRQGTQHRFAYDQETLAHVLALAGFVSVRARAFTHDSDSPHREFGTLYMTAEKPVAPASAMLGTGETGRLMTA